jgi:hypothetical protein
MHTDNTTLSSWQKCSGGGTRRKHCATGLYAQGHVEGEPCGETRQARWQCATSYLMELLYAQILDTHWSDGTVVVPEAIDYTHLVTTLLTDMHNQTSAKYPDQSLWPVEGVEEGNVRKPNIASLHMREPWKVYDGLMEWLFAVYLYYSIDSDIRPNTSSPLDLANAITALFGRNKATAGLNTTLFLKQLHRWCKAAVPYHEHATRCPSPGAPLKDVIQKLQDALPPFNKPKPKQTIVENSTSLHIETVPHIEEPIPFYHAIEDDHVHKQKRSEEPNADLLQIKQKKPNQTADGAGSNALPQRFSFAQRPK